MSAFSPIPEETIYFTMERCAFSSSVTFNKSGTIIMIDIGTLFNCVPAQFSDIFKVLGGIWKWLQECWMSCCGRRATLNTFGGRQMTIWEITIEQNKDVPAQIFSSNSTLILRTEPVRQWNLKSGPDRQSTQLKKPRTHIAFITSGLITSSWTLLFCKAIHLLIL